MPTAGFIMTSLKNIINILFPDTSANLKIRPCMEGVAVNPREPCSTLNDKLLFLGG